MKNIKILLLLITVALWGIPAFAQNFYRPWSSYVPVKPQKPYEHLETLTLNLQKQTCYYNNNYYEPNQIITDLDITKEEVFNFFKRCCQNHISRCVSSYIGINNKTLLYTLVENKAYSYMQWILNEGFVYESYIDQWGVYEKTNEIIAPIRNYNPMMLACKMGDLNSVKILRANGSYLSQPENAIGLTPFDFAQKYHNGSDFFKYIKKEYQEEIKNINTNTYYGTTFSMNNILQKFIDSFEKNFYENQQKINDKVKEINKA